MVIPATVATTVVVAAISRTLHQHAFMCLTIVIMIIMIIIMIIIIMIMIITIIIMIKIGTQI